MTVRKCRSIENHKVYNVTIIKAKHYWRDQSRKKSAAILLNIFKFVAKQILKLMIKNTLANQSNLKIKLP